MGLYILDTDTLRKGWAVAGSVARRRGEKKSCPYSDYSALEEIWEAKRFGQV
jgi:hypothetical protein